MTQDLTYPQHADGRLDRDGTPTIWSNPDVPRHTEMLNGETGFTCPYPGCGDDFNFEGFEERDHLLELLEGENGTFRCGECDEPIYGIYGDGDGNHE